jgi:hypothetical protein
MFMDIIGSMGHYRFYVILLQSPRDSPGLADSIDNSQNEISFIRIWHENLPLRGVKKEVFSYL